MSTTSAGSAGDLQAGGNSPEARAHEVADALPDDQEELLHQAFGDLAKGHSLGPAQTRELQAMIGTLSDLAKEGTSVGDLKIASAALAEMTEAFRVFRPYRKIRKITMFGSARTLPEDPVYILARDLASHLAQADWMVVTGAGPGIMAAGLEGAGREHAFGVNIRLPHEEGANVFIAQDPKLVEMRYFFTRKLMLIKESHAYAILPGGFGTQDEAFELLTLLQTGKAEPAPVVMLETPNGTYWQGWLRFVAGRGHRFGLGLARRHGAVQGDHLGRGGHGRDPRLLSQLPLLPLGGRPPGAAPPDGAEQGRAGRPQPPLRRHRLPGHRSAMRRRSPRSARVRTSPTCPGSRCASTSGTSPGCGCSSTPSTNARGPEAGAQRVGESVRAQAWARVFGAPA